MYRLDGPDVLPDGGEEGDDVMVDLVLDLENAVHAESGLFLDYFQVLGGDEALVRLDLAGGDLDVEPDPELVLKVPYAGDFLSE